MSPLGEKEDDLIGEVTSSCPTAIALMNSPDGDRLTLSGDWPALASPAAAPGIALDLSHPRGVVVRVGGVYIWGER
jgi:hypothetical protein